MVSFIFSPNLAQVTFSSSISHQSIFYGSSKGWLYFFGIFLRTFCDVRGHPSRIRTKPRRSLARKQSTRAHPSFRRDSTRRSVHVTGGTRRTRASRAAGSRQRAGAARHKKAGLRNIQIQPQIQPKCSLARCRPNTPKYRQIHDVAVRLSAHVFVHPSHT